MKILAVDDEKLGLEALVKAIQKTLPEAEVIGFNSPKEALSYAKENEIFAACLDVQMPEMLGSELAKKLKSINPSIYILYLPRAMTATWAMLFRFMQVATF